MGDAGFITPSRDSTATTPDAAERACKGPRHAVPPRPLLRSKRQNSRMKRERRAKPGGLISLRTDRSGVANEKRIGSDVSLDESDDTEPYDEGHYDGTNSGDELEDAPVSILKTGTLSFFLHHPVHYLTARPIAQSYFCRVEPSSSTVRLGIELDNVASLHPPALLRRRMQ